MPECATRRNVEFQTTDFLKELEIDFESLRAILRQFERLEFIQELNLTKSHLSLLRLLEAEDYIQKGGFVVQEEIFKAELEKLGIEVEKLKEDIEPDNLDKLNKISGIVAALFTGLALMKPSNEIEKAKFII